MCIPEQIVDYLALVGDSSDNIPGITGVGPKTAAKWLNQYRTLDALVADAGAISGKVGENLRGELPALELSRKLATIDTQRPARGLAGGSGRRRSGPAAAAAVVYAARTAGAAQVAGVRRVRRRVRSCRGRWVAVQSCKTGAADAPPAAGGSLERAEPRHYQEITSPEALDAWIAKLAAAPLVSFDTETDRPDYMRARLVGMSFAVDRGRSGLRASRARLCGRASAARYAIGYWRL